MVIHIDLNQTYASRYFKFDNGTSSHVTTTLGIPSLVVDDSELEVPAPPRAGPG